MRSAFRSILLLGLAVFALGACGSSSPQLKVIGVGQAQTRGPGVKDGKMLVVFVEVVNDTKRDLELSKLEYRLATESWFSSEGAVRLSRGVGPGSTAVVEIPVPYRARVAAGQVAYSFRGTLYAQDSHVERTWRVSQDGTLEDGVVSVRPVGLETRVAGQK